MQTKLRLGGVLLFLMAIAAITVGPASSSGSGGDDDRVTVVRVTAVTVQEAGLDLGDTGDSLGDEFVFRMTSSAAARRSASTALSARSCAWSRWSPPLCSASQRRRKGQITAQALLTFLGEEEGEPETSIWAITGGTGKYKEAGGELRVVDVSETEARLTFKITD